jgi:hypothetical protein
MASSGGETVAGGETEGDEDEGRKEERRRMHADSLSRLEGRSPIPSSAPAPVRPASSRGVPSPLSPSDRKVVAGSSEGVFLSPVPHPSALLTSVSTDLRGAALVARFKNASARDSGRSSRASVATLDSLLSGTGDSVYEDATEGSMNEAEWEEDDGLDYCAFVSPFPVPSLASS